MKRTVLFLLLTSLILSSCGVQNKGTIPGASASTNGTENKDYLTTTQTVVYDFKTKEYTKSMVHPRVREPLVFKIENINRLAYDVSIKSKDVAIVDENFKEEIDNTLKKKESETTTSEPITPKIITETKLASTALISTAKTTNSPSIIQEITTLKTAIQTNTTELIKLQTANQQKIDSIKNSTLSLENLKDDAKAIDPKNNKIIIEQEIISIQNRLKINQLKIDALQGENIAKTNEIISKTYATDAVERTFSEFSKIYTEVLDGAQSIRIIEENYHTFYQLALNPLLKCEGYEKLSNDPKFILYQLPQYRSQINDFNKTITNFNNFYNQAINNWRIFDDIEAPEAKENIRIKYQSYKEEIDKIKASIDALDLPSKLRKVEAIHAVLKEKEAYQISSSPIQPLEDYVTFDVTIKNRDQSKLAEYDDNREFTYLEYTRGGVRFDFSTGIVFNFIGNNDKYGLVDVNVDTNGDGKEDTAMKKIVVTENNQFTPALAGMFHTSFRSCGIWAFGLTLGASVNVETFELNSLFPGVSLLIGKKQKFIISAGPAFRQVDELKANYREDGIYSPSDFTDETLLTAKQFKVGFFCGITYNLTQKQREKFKIGTE
ncbi:hypothetical protein [Flavobacterium sp. LAR06]|uniref:hypothetical protein n=1 Tax=Flavobacterium sp. LAR06 TaxID=3064897 RepID=UPI0035BF86FB